MSPLSTLVLALFLLSASLTACPCSAQTLYSLCYTLSSSLPQSPVFPWSVSVFGTLNVSAPLAGSGGGLVAVQSATLQRTAVYRGLTYNTVTGSLAADNSYQSNDNVLSLTAPYLFDAHSLAFVFASSIYSAYGNSSGHMVAVYNDSTYGLAEDNVPPNDGVLSATQATFSLSPTSAYTANVACSQPTLLTPTAADLTALNTAVVYTFCYSFTGGPGDGTAGSTWSISVQGNLTTSQYSGAGADGAVGSVVAGIQAVRVYSDPNGVISSSRISGLANSNWQHGTYASNVLYATYPYFDTYGLFYQSDAPLLNIELASASSSATLTIAQLSVDSYNMFDETVYDTSTATPYLTPVGVIDLTPAVGGNLSTLQCANTAGALLSYAFCYTLTSDSTSASQFSIVTYGVLQATGPVIRQGRPALTMQSMTGVRTHTAGNVTATQNIVRLVFINGETDLTNAAILNDNTLYVDDQSAPIDYYGFVYALSSNAVFPSQTSPTTDINLSAGDGVWYEWPVLGGNGAETTTATFNFSAATNPTSFPCAISSSNIPLYQPSTSVQFCYTAQGDQWSLIAQGTLVQYGAVITFGGRAALALQSANGSRTYYSANGTVNTVAITGVSADSFGAVNYTTYNQLLYTSTPYVDAAGLLLTLASSPAALTPSGPITGDPVVNLMLLADGSVVEQVEEASAGSANRTVVTLLLGSAASSCSVNTFGAGGGGGGGGGGLSHGAIAGIVVGSVVGGALLIGIVACAVAAYVLAAANRASKPTALTPSSPQHPAATYDQQRDTSSKANGKGVELA